MTVAGFLLALGAVLRLTRLVTDDLAARGLRAWVDRRWGDYGLAAYFVRCSWCVSWWLALPISCAAHLYGNSWLFVAPCAALSLSYLTGMAAMAETRLSAPINPRD